MKLMKALNNNVALVQDKNGQEAVVMGKGVAFNAKPGDPVREFLIEKHFVLNGDGGKKDFDSLLKRITVDDIELASGIIREGEELLGYRCNDSILLTLSDHLGMLLERMKKGIHFGTPLEWDIKLIYPKEYQFAKKAVADLSKKTGYEIPEQEAAFIVLHFILIRLISFTTSISKHFLAKSMLIWPITDRMIKESSNSLFSIPPS